MKDFAKALNSNSIIEMQRIPKSDLHSHARRSGHVSYIEAWTGIQINKPPKVFNSLDHIQEWFDVTSVNLDLPMMLWKLLKNWNSKKFIMVLQQQIPNNRTEGIEQPRSISITYN